MAQRECLDCRTLHTDKGSRCTTCTAAREQQRDSQRGSRHTRGLGSDHERIRKQLLADNPMCHWCEQQPATHADHLQPRSHDGQNVIENYVPSCAHCNLSRGNRATPKG